MHRLGSRCAGQLTCSGVAAQLADQKNDEEDCSTSNKARATNDVVDCTAGTIPGSCLEAPLRRDDTGWLVVQGGYVPPSVRNRAGAGAGDSMHRREENSVRVTNLSEDTREEDLRVRANTLKT